jgi:hypothetical protein
MQNIFKNSKFSSEDLNKSQQIYEGGGNDNQGQLKRKLLKNKSRERLLS